jgi:hypothetical protein
MRCVSSLLLMLLTAMPAAAQQYYAEQTYPAPPSQAPQQVSGIYQGDPYYAPPAQPQYQPPQPQAAPANQPQPGEYGASVMTDIRQMNF